ncbi:PIN domain-containing protein [Ramlibacter sp.]|uniref:PIN domain-containing protein n=1 Tax=Ramlibacter sp. TaxID=1917967 RepID=UPI003D14F538
MPKYLLDTNACIAVRDAHRNKSAKNPATLQRREKVHAKWRATQAADVAMSVITMGELRYGADKSASPQRSHALLDALSAMISVLPLSADVCRHYGEIRHQLHQNPIGPNDSWIAAHARQAGCAVVTGHTCEFDRVSGLITEDWTQ